MRLAFLTPLPPAATGIADYSAEVLHALAGEDTIDVFHDQPQVDRGALPAGTGVFTAASFLERHRRVPYDLAVYQMGNAPAHAFLYPLLARVPGLVVLHDLVLHHSRARTFVDSPEARDYAREPWSAARREAALQRIAEYRAEVEYAYPGRGTGVVEAQLGTGGSLLPYAYPLFELVVEASRLTAVHNAFSADAIREAVPGSAPVVVTMPMAAVPVAASERAALRDRLGLAADDFVVASYGLLTPEKRIETTARAVARAQAFLPRIRLLLVGPVPDRARLDRRLEALGVAPRTVVTGRVAAAELAQHIDAADAVVHLRYPTARETSAALLRVLAQGRATVMSDLAHWSDVPDDAVVRVDVTDEEGEVLRALLRLADHAGLRARLGEAATRFVGAYHSRERCRTSYFAAIEEARRRTPRPRTRPWPAHWPVQP